MTLYAASVSEYSRRLRVYDIGKMEDVTTSRNVFFVDTKEGHYVGFGLKYEKDEDGGFMQARVYSEDFFLTDKTGNIIDFYMLKYLPITPDRFFSAAVTSKVVNGVDSYGYAVNPTEKSNGFDNPSIERQMNFFIETLCTKKGERQ